VKPARAPEAFLVYCEIDSFGRGWTVLQRVCNTTDNELNFLKENVEIHDRWCRDPDETEV